jgi:hypothetical protein
MNLSDRSETEDRLKQILQAAKDEYESTKRRFEVAMELKNGGREQSPSIRDLEEAHKGSIEQYRRALLNFNHFIFESRPIIGAKPNGSASEAATADAIHETEQGPRIIPGGRPPHSPRKINNTR